MACCYSLSTFTKHLGFTLLFCFITFSVFAQTGSIKGKVKTSDGTAAAYVNVTVKEIPTKGTISEQNGNYHLKNIQPGTYTIVISRVGLSDQEKNATVTAGETTNLDFDLVENIGQLREVEISEKKTPNQRPVSIGKAAIKPMDLPQSVAIVGSEVIAEQQASKLSDVIKNVNGVSLGTSRGTTAETFFARGYNLGANNIMKNGARSNSAVIPEASTLESVEVLKGSAALLYGNVSGGAVINMVTKQPKYEFGGEVAMRVGSYSFYKPIVDVYGPITKKLAYRMVGTYETAESFRNNVESKKIFVNPSLLYKIGVKTDILVQADYLKNDLTPDFGIGSLGNTQIPTTISRSEFFNTPWAYNEVEQKNASIAVNHQFNPDWKLNVVAARQLFDRNYFSTERIQADADGDWGRKLTRSKIGEDYYNGQINLNGIFKTGAIGHNLLVGTDAERYMNITNTFKIDNGKATYDSINILNPNKFVPRPDMPEALNTFRNETPTYRFGVFAQDLISVSEKFKVLAGLRYSYQKVAKSKSNDLEKDEVKTAAGSASKYDRALSPRLGVVYQPVPSTSVFASYSNNFAPNTGKDVYESNLKPSIIDQYEVGVKNDLIQGKLTANFTVYRIINSDLAMQAQFEADGTTVNTNANVKEFTGQTTSDGAEIDLSGNIAKGLNLLAGYSYNFMRYTKTTGTTGSYITGERLVSNPAHTANASLFYTFDSSILKGFKVGVSGFYTGKRNAGWNNMIGQKEKHSRLIPVSSFTTFDVSLGYTYKSISIIGKVSNITDELNYLVHENYSVNPIAPRQFVTTVSYKF